MGRGTLSKVQDGSRHHRGGLGRGEGPMGIPRTGRRTLEEFRDGPGDPQRGPGRVRARSRRSGTDRKTHAEV